MMKLVSFRTLMSSDRAEKAKVAPFSLSIRGLVPTVLACVVVVLLSACSTSSSYRIIADEDGWIRNSQDEKIELKKSEMKEFSASEPFWIEAPGKMPILAVPLSSSNAAIQAKFKALGTPESWDAKAVETRALRLADEVLHQSHEIEVKISKRDFDGALRDIEALLKSYPSLTYLRWMKASTLVLLGRKQEAELWVRETLRIDPENKAGQALYERLKRDLGVSS